MLLKGETYQALSPQELLARQVRNASIRESTEKWSKVSRNLSKYMIDKFKTAHSGFDICPTFLDTFS